MIALKVILIGCLASIAVQDIKQRQVYWFLFPLVGICSGALFYASTLTESFTSAIGVNLLIVMLFIGLLSLYVRVKLGVGLSKVMGLGDVLLFMGLAFSFSTVSFLVLLVSSLVFSLIMHLFVSKGIKEHTVPLAGYISVFFGLSFLAFWGGLINALYSI